MESSNINILDLTCIISLHKKGFWQADVFDFSGGNEGNLPIWFCTGKTHDDQYSVISKASVEYPGIKFLAAISGQCEDCGEQYFMNENECTCNGKIIDA